MSNLKPGDKVKFLNAPGGGIISRIIDSRTAGVMVEDGFEIPTLISELIPVGNIAGPAARYFDETYKVSGQQDVPEDPEETSDDRSVRLARGVVAGRKAEEVYLAFVPHDQKWLITGQVDIVVVNNTSYDLLYNILGRTPSGHFSGLDYGSVFSDSRQVVATINREQLTHWTEGSLQFLFHRESMPVAQPPFNSEFRIDGKKFYKEGNYREHPLIGARGIVVRVVALEPAGSGDTPAGTGGSNQAGPGDRPWIERHRVAAGEAVVDLHIHELVDDVANFEKSEILEFQKSYFLKCLDSALIARYRRVIFIHGIGNGILRDLLTGLLKKQEGIEFFDAPLAEYGRGAIDVRIAVNR